MLADAVFGEEITNKFPRIGATDKNHQMCPPNKDFKHLTPLKATKFRAGRKVSSIIPAKVSSIMTIEAMRVTPD